MGISVGYDMVSAILTNEIEDALNLQLQPEWLKETEQELYLFVKHHIQKYSKIPDLGVVKKEFPEFSQSNTTEPPQFYADKVRERYLFENLKKGMKESQAYLDKKLTDFNPDTAMEKLSDTIAKLRFMNNRSDVVDFRDAHDTLHADYIAKVKGLYDGAIRLGWETADEFSGGMVGGDVVSILGRPGQGKTWALLHSALRGWVTQKSVPMMVSMEMIPLPIQQRLSAMMMHINPTYIKNAEMSTIQKNKLFTGLKGIKSYDTPFWIVNGNLAASVEDLFNLALQLKPSVIYIDGAYLLQAENRRAMGWERVADTSNGIKRFLSTELNIPVVATYQFNREAAKKLKKDPMDVGLEDIAGADAVGQNSSVVMGLLQEENIESLHRKYMSILKGRSGECGGFWMNWDFKGVDFSEIDLSMEQEQELQYLM